MNISEVISRSWKIFWKHKILWVFGILAGLGANFNNIRNMFTYRLDQGTGIWNQLGLDFLPRYFMQGPGRDGEIYTWIALITTFGLIVALALWAIRVFGKAGLVRGVWQADEEKPRLSFSSLFREGAQYFWRLILLDLITFGVILLIILVLFLPGLALIAGASQNRYALIFLLLPLVCILTPLVISIKLYIELVIQALVGENLSIAEAFKRGWKVLSKSLGMVIVIALILYAINLIVGYIISIPMIAIIIPTILTGSLHGLMDFPNLLPVLLPGLIILLPIAIFISGVQVAFTSTVWTVTFRRLSARLNPVEPVNPAPELPTPVTETSEN